MKRALANPCSSDPIRTSRRGLVTGVFLCGSLLTGSLPAQAPTPQSPPPTGGYLDWVFYDDLPDSEQRRISGQCPGSFIDPWESPDLPDDQLAVEADRTRGEVNGTVRFTGDVRITDNVLRLFGPEARTNNREGTFELPAGGLLRQAGTAARTTAAEARRESGWYRLYDARYTLHQANLHGFAETFTQEDNIYHLERSWVTRCAPGRFGWSLHARDLYIDRNTDFATGYHATLNVGPVPVAYTPYIRLNLNQQRSSGFLPPSVSYYSSYDQWRVSTPYYWAIAPNADTTTTVDWMLGGEPADGAPQTAHIWQEARYLNRDFRADARAGVYPGQNDPNTDEAQWGYDLTATSRDTAVDWSVDIRDANAADYYSEFMGEPWRATHTNTLAAGYRFDTTQTRVTARVQNQSVFPGASQSEVGDALDYVEQPGVHLQQPLPAPGDWRLEAQSDLERRRHGEPRIAELNPTEADPLEGQRYRTRLTLNRTDRWGAWTFSQRYTGDHTRYRLPAFEERVGIAHPADGQDRWLWDTRHRLSYGIELTDASQLTPYVQHQYRPLDEEQTQLPLMNSGVDRLDDLNRVHLGSQFSWRRDDLRFSSDLNQRFNLEKTLLRDHDLADDNWTNPQAGPITWSNRFNQANLNSIGATLAWKPDRNPPGQPEDLSFYGSNYQPYRFSLSYSHTPDRAALRFASNWNLDNDGEDAPVQTVDIAAAVPLTSTFGFFGLANWERPEEADPLALTETIAGIEYDGCCWHVQLASQRTVNPDDEESSVSGNFDTIQLSLTLKGLGGVAGQNRIGERLREQLPTFDETLFNTE